jgi:hypothetical protein
MCALWSALSSREPSQQFGKFTWSRSEPDLHVGIVAEAVNLRLHLHDVTLLPWAARAAAFPPIILRPAGKG